MGTERGEIPKHFMGQKWADDQPIMMTLIRSKLPCSVRESSLSPNQQKLESGNKRTLSLRPVRRTPQINNLSHILIFSPTKSFLSLWVEAKSLWLLMCCLQHQSMAFPPWPLQRSKNTLPLNTPSWLGDVVMRMNTETGRGQVCELSASQHHYTCVNPYQNGTLIKSS